MAEIYGEAYYDSWGEGDSTEAYWELKKALFRKLVGASGVAGGNAMDIGCATGACLSVLRERGFVPHGIDVNPYAIQRAKSLVPGARLSEGTLEEAGFERGTFSLIVMSDVLEHSRDPQGLLKTAERFLAPGGKILIVTPDLESLTSKLMGRWWPHIKMEHLFYFSGRALRQMLEKCGFGEITIATAYKPLNPDYAIRQFETYPVPVITPLAKAAHRLVPARLKNWTAFFPMGEMLAIASKP